jgi:choline dehydrogenase
MDFDFIIAGAGSAGCVLANRLSADPANRVLLLEAGPTDSNVWIHVPLGFGKNLTNANVNWCFESAPETSVGGRRDYLPRGKVLGGSSSINGMVYMRGQRQDYDHWAQLGCRGWSYDDVLPYFRKAENNSRGEDEFHGVGGPLQVTDLSERTAIVKAFVKAGQEVGLPFNPDLNGAEQEGIGFTQVTIANGQRNSTASAYLKPAKKRSNLHIETDAHVHRVLFDSKRANGIAYDVRGERREARAAREVILCGGAYGSPQMLELSGIGDPQRLGELGIDVRHPLHGVGNGLQDHQIFRMRWRLKGAAGTFNERVRGLRALFEGINYVVRRRGVLTNPTNPVNAFLRSRPELAAPDVQIQFLPASYKSVRDRTLERESGVTIGPTLLRLEGRGSVHAQSTDPHMPPAILTNLLATENDCATAVRAMRFTRRLMEAPALQPFYDHELTPGVQVQTDDEFADYAREIGASNWHPASTCRMGPDGDAGAVVDTELRVRGVAGLRVVDASVMPTVVCGNTNAPTIMIAEKAAELILRS